MCSYKVVRKEDLNDQDFLIEVKAPRIASTLKPGQFVVLMTNEHGERIPMSVKTTTSDTITMFIKRLGKTSLEIDDYKVGDSFYQVIGPQGKSFPIQQYGNVIWCSDLVCGHAENYAYCEALSKINGNHVISIQSFPTKNGVYGDEDLRSVSDEYYITTEDGSYGRRGHYNDVLKDLLEENRVDIVLGCGKIDKLKEMAELTKQYGVETKAVLRQIMIDGTGMCGACRVFIDGVMKLTCIDGPLFDAHKVNFDEVINRLQMFKEPESLAKKLYLERRRN
ncbi:sulfide/dihydroorotate dehydrogenase-like FAD/NAD-binding protein [Candidatus Bathyarchaeota archaeon]|nr:sulfide/dihydroorotate dehydrogenase-like FAD/NAD-binding protein [Candidatus Bathyarchaeota archaeon]